MILIAGPCVIESKELVFEVAKKLVNLSQKSGVDFYFKSSFDKANRTSISSFRGPGLEKGCEILADVKKEFEAMLKLVKEVKEAADEENDYGTSALVDEYISTYEKDLWMLNAYLK